MSTSDAPRRAYRDGQDLWLGGVASGLARHLGLPTSWVRAGFVVLAALGGAGLALYGGLWIMLPGESRFPDQAPGLASASRTGRRSGRRPGLGPRRLRDVGPVVALAAVVVGVLLIPSTFSGGTVLGQTLIVWPLLFGVVGLALLWRQADEAQRERWLDSTGHVDPLRIVFGRGGWASYARVGAGVLLVAVGLVVFGVDSGSFHQARSVFVAGLLGFVGLALVVGPWVLRLTGDLTAERAERIRTQERADVAAHLHDSVLQTLALIQKNAADSAAVSRLARAQERDLRSWLYDDQAPGAATLATALRAIAAETEDGHGVVVDVVAVGDAEVDEHLRPLVDATREAVTNAAKHAGTARVDVYAEVTDGSADVFVRDRGSGFDLDAVPADRLGVRRSIVDRMARHGGTGRVRSAPGEGTEVHLTMPMRTTHSATSAEGPA